MKRMQAAGAQAYLVNTGWNGTGKRISIKDTRAIIDAILNGSLDNAETFRLPLFDLAIPTELPGVDTTFSTRVTPTRRRNNGRKKPPRWRNCSLRTSRSIRIPRQAKRWLAPDRSCKEQAGWRL